MKEPKTFKEAVATFEKYYDDWIKSEEYQLKVLFKQGLGDIHRDDGRLATGAIVAIMSVLKDPSASRALHNLDRPLYTNTVAVPLSITPDEHTKVKAVIQQKMRTLLQDHKYEKVRGQLYDFRTPSPHHLPDWIREFYLSSMYLLSDMILVLGK